jgi:hypothetical protein
MLRYRTPGLFMRRKPTTNKPDYKGGPFPFDRTHRLYCVRVRSHKIISVQLDTSGPDSSVGIATGYGLDGPGVESGFGGLGVCMLASGTQDHGFAPYRSRRIFLAGKIHSMPSFVQYQNNKVHDTNKYKKKSRWGRDISHTSRPALGLTQPPVQWVLGLSRG